jgi:hypothetical protein
VSISFFTPITTDHFKNITFVCELLRSFTLIILLRVPPD